MGMNMKNKNDVEVLINGRKYTICGFESAEYLQKVATYINSKYMEFKDKDYYYSLDMDLRNILLAVNIADDYFKARKQAEVFEEGEICVPGKYFADFIKKLEGVQITLSSENKKMDIFYADSQTNMQILSADDFPKIDTEIRENSFKCSNNVVYSI